MAVQVGNLTTWASVETGDFHTCATRQDGSLFCWGNNNQGQLADGTTTNRPSPTQVGALTTWASTSGGQVHTCAEDRRLAILLGEQLGRPARRWDDERPLRAHGGAASGEVKVRGRR